MNSEVQIGKSVDFRNFNSFSGGKLLFQMSHPVSTREFFGEGEFYDQTQF